MKILIAGASSDVGCAFIKYLNNKKQQGLISDDLTVFCHYNSNRQKIDNLAGEVSYIEIIPLQADLSLSQQKKSQSENELSNQDNTVHSGKTLLELMEDAPDYFVYLPATKFDYMRLKQLDIEKIKMEMQINVYSFLEIAKEILPAMKKKEKAGVLTMLTSFVTDELPPRFMTDYIVTKYALLGATKSLIAEFESEKLHIDYIAPAMMDTHFLDNIDPRIKEMNAAKNASGRLLLPEDICEEMYNKLFIFH